MIDFANALQFVHPLNTALQWKSRFLQQPMKGVILVSVKINNGGTLSLIDSHILNKLAFSDLPKSMF